LLHGVAAALETGHDGVAERCALLRAGRRGGAAVLAAPYAAHHGARRGTGGRALACIAADGPAYGAHGGSARRASNPLARRRGLRWRRWPPRLLRRPPLTLRRVLLLLLRALPFCWIHCLGRR